MYIILNISLLQNLFIYLFIHCSDMFWPQVLAIKGGGGGGGQELRSKQVREINNKKIVQHVCVKYYICNTFAQEMYDIKFVVLVLC
jgi:hypothetical protein